MLGVAPAVHGSALLDINHTGAQAYVEYLRNQAIAGNCDLVCFGTVTVGQVTKNLRWYFDPRSNRMVPEDSDELPRRLLIFIAKAANGTASNMFVGLPNGMGRRWAIDYDVGRLPH